MVWKSPSELSRRAVHFLILIVLTAYYIINKTVDQKAAMLTMVGVLLFFLILEYLRVEWDITVPLYSKIIMPKERDRLSSIIHFLTATVICLAIFDFKVALAALLMTTFGDLIAAVIGRKYGETLIFRNKTLVGSVSELIINLVIGFFILTNIYVMIGMAFTATLVEILVDDLDDNLLGPLFAGFVGQLMILLI
jgi:dolichol kinase